MVAVAVGVFVAVLVGVLVAVPVELAIVSTAPPADWPSGLVSVTVCSPALAPTVEIFNVTDVELL